MCKGTPSLQLCGIVGPKLSYEVLESSLKGNQGAKNIHFSASILELTHNK